jgi:type II secretory pathway component PulC
MKDILNKIKIITSFNKIKPHEHWEYLINIFFIIIFILILLSFYLMYQIKNQQIYQVNPTTKDETVLINEKILNKVKTIFDNKLIVEKEIKDGLKSYPDPSL